MEFIEKLKSLENVDNINNTKSKNLYIKELTDKYSLYETGFELKIERISHYYIISTYQQAEQFFKLFLEELKPLIPNLGIPKNLQKIKGKKSMMNISNLYCLTIKESLMIGLSVIFLVIYRRLQIVMTK